jgi:hypothetical protein
MKEDPLAIQLIALFFEVSKMSCADSVVKKQIYQSYFMIIFIANYFILFLPPGLLHSIYEI